MYMYIDLIYISTFLIVFFPYLLKSCKGNLFTNMYSCTTVYSAERLLLLFKRVREKNMIGYHSLRENKDLFGGLPFY